ncbi:MAG: AAA family ATPase [Acidobacteriota bacterium]|nr:AAA family ATPase [Acidobacteriota bacterium]
MYEKHFQLQTAPFSLNPDPRFLYVTPSFREAIATLAYGITNRRGFVLLTGDVGTGKTTLLNVFVQWLVNQSACTAFVFNPRLDPDEFVSFMMADFGVPCNARSKSERLIALNQWLLELQHDGRPAVLIVDEAQQLSEETLEELRLLTNLETPTQKLLQIVLSGQSELEGILARPSLRQLKQRISLRCKTLPLSSAQTIEYIARRVQVAGGSANRIFLPEAFETIYRYSEGTVRLVNLICENALMGAFCDDEPMVGARHVEQAAQELELEDPAAPDEELDEVAANNAARRVTKAGKGTDE